MAIQEIQQLHDEIWGKVKRELRLDTSRVGSEQPPYLWYGSPLLNFDALSRDVSLQLGANVSPEFRDNFVNIVTGHKKVGLTLVMSTDSQVCLPGIIIGEAWPQVISHPDRILLHENINSALARSSNLYQMASSTDFLVRRFGRSGYNLRNILATFTENIGTEMTNVLQEKMNIDGKYLDDDIEFFVDRSDREVKPMPDQQRLIEEYQSVSMVQTLIDLIDSAKYNPASQSRELFEAWINELSNKAPKAKDQFQAVKKQILRVSTEFKDHYGFILMKNVDGDWVKFRNR